MSASKPTSQWYRNVISGFTTPTSFKHNNGMAYWSFSHRYTLCAPLYLLEGRQEIHDMMVIDASNTLYPKTDGTYPGASAPISNKRYSISGTTYFTAIPDGSEARTDWWMINVLTQGVFCADDATPEKPYIKDILDDSLKAANFLINTQGAASDPGWLTLGGWNLNEDTRRGPGNTFSGDSESQTAFFQGYGGQTLGPCYRLYPSSDLSAWCTQLYTLVDNLYRVTAGNGWMGNSYNLRMKQAPGTQANATLTIAAVTDPLLNDSNIDAIIYRTDGVVWGCSNDSFTNVYPAINDRHYLTDTRDLSLAYYNGPPPELTNYGTYYIRQPSGTYAGWKYATTNSDGTIIASYSASSASTLNGAINNSVTTVVTNATLTFASNAGNASKKLIVVGTEVMQVTAGAGTTTLTVQRGVYGSTAASHSNGDAIYVPYQSFMFGDYQNRTVAFPPTGHCYRYSGAAAAIPEGYLTLMRSMAGHGFINGFIAQTAFNNADLWFNDASIPAGSGPGGFAANNSLKDSVDISL
jgi:hypothetical protein